MKKRTLSWLLVTAMTASVVMSACSSGGETAGTTAQTTKAAEAGTAQTATEAAQEDAAGGGLLNETGYPIVNEPITLKVGVRTGDPSLDGEWADLTWIQELQRISGITFEFVEYADSEAVSLMFASCDYPDISFNVGSDKQIREAAEGGDLYALDEYIQQYAPNWHNYFEDDKQSKALVTSPDGHIYSLPMIWEDPDRTLRDIWFINKRWLDELNLDMPTTTDEFYNVLKAFKENAGKGSIPEDVIPFLPLGITSHGSGALDLINSFGVRVSSQRYYVTVDDNGKIEFNFANEAIKEPLKYMRKLVEEDLLPVEFVTISGAEYTTKTRSAEPCVGSFFTNVFVEPIEDIVALAPLDSGNGKTPMKRGAVDKVTRNLFTVYKNCQYPEAALRLADLIADPEMSLQARYGMIDGHFLDKDEEGHIVVLTTPPDEMRATSAPCNKVAFLLTEEMYENVVYEEGSDAFRRFEARENIYKDYIIPQKNQLPNLMFSAENVDRISELYTDIKGQVDSTFADWMVNGGIDEGWDEYIAQLEAYGLEEFLSLLQEEYDHYLSLAQ